MRGLGGKEARREEARLFNTYSTLGQDGRILQKVGGDHCQQDVQTAGGT